MDPTAGAPTTLGVHTGAEIIFVHWRTMSTEPSGLRATSSFAGPTTARPVDPTTVGEHPPSAPRRDGDGDGERRPTRAPHLADDPGRSTARRKAPSRRKRKVRKVHRVVRHVEVWSIAKVAAVFVACGYVTGMISGYLLWRAADRVGTIDGIEGFVEDSGSYETFDILGDLVFRVAAVTGAALAFLTLAVVVLGALLFNLVSDLTGGVRMTVIDEDLIVAPARRRGGPPPSGPDPAGRNRS